MANIIEEYKKILSEIEQTISNKQEREIVKQKASELSILFVDTMNNITNTLDSKLKRIEENQNDIDKRMAELTKSVDEIEKDIYDDERVNDGEYDIEIVCPYCNYEFVTDFTMIDDEKNEIKCPECNNIIEVDWNEEEEDTGCQGHCSGCHGCGDEEEIDEDEDDDM